MIMKLINLLSVTNRIMMLALFSLLVMQGCKQQSKEGEGEEAKADEESMDEQSEAMSETEDDWTVLFDGSSVEQWRGYQKDSFPESGWTIEDGALKCIGSGKGEAGGSGGDIITREKYDDFELQLEWKISEGGNSGILFMAQELEGEPIWKSAPEMQILDNERHPDAKLGKNGNRKAGSLYDLIPADPQNAKPAGEWNKIRIMKYQGTVVFFMNGEQVVEFHLWTDDWNDMIANSKFADFKDFAKESEGYIGLQDHGNDVWFRNIKIKRL